MPTFLYVAVVIDTDGSAFITKAEFDSLKNNFQAQIDNYNSSIDSKIDGAIASYLSGIRLSTIEQITPIMPVGEKIISTTGNDYGWKEGQMEINLDYLTGPYGDYGSHWAMLLWSKITNVDSPSNFRETRIKYDPVNKTGLYISTDMTRQSITGSSISISGTGYSTTATEGSTMTYFAGWNRVDVDDDSGSEQTYGAFCRTSNDLYASTTIRQTFSGNRAAYLGRGEGDNGHYRNLKSTLIRSANSDTAHHYVVPNSSSLVFGFYDASRTRGFCNDSSIDDLTDFDANIGSHSIIDVTTYFTNECSYAVTKRQNESTWTAVVPLPVFTWPNNYGINHAALNYSNFSTWSTVPDAPGIWCELAKLSPTESTINNIGYYHKPYIGCEDIKNWNKVGMDYGSHVNSTIKSVNSDGTLVNVNGSEYLSPVSGAPVFIATNDGTAELLIKFEKDADYMPDTNSSYADLYISSKPFKENDLGNGSGVIGPKTGSSSRKLLSDQPAGHGAGSIKVNYDEVTNLIFKVYKDEPIFINFSAYEPSQSSYRGKCTATIQSAIKLTKEE